ncbi:MAG: DUF349 domain-containing protein [Bacteroidales bacterium]|jgi:hypothetical protein|nr:DUF349 domain-containing protein [Bacteroidales bacterium]MCI1733544.1 DUF349 domain-containing protein [Bacteroidales bacterium]
MEEKTTALNAQENLGVKEAETKTADVQPVKEADAEKKPSANAHEILDGSVVDYSTKSLSEILRLFEEMVERGDQQELYKNADIIKASFYKVLKKEKIASGMFMQPGSEDAATAGEVKKTEEGEETVSNNPFAEVERGFKELYAKYKLERASYTKEQEKGKEENLKLKLGIIDEINKLLEKAEDVNHTFPAFRDLQAKWKALGAVPQEKAKDLWENYNHTIEKFYDYIKINNEFRDIDFKKNLEAKTELCKKAEYLVNAKNVVNAFNELQKLHEEWKDLGPVAKDQREPIWERFKAATSQINKKHQEYFENLKEQQKKNLAGKSELCESAEKIAEEKPEESNQWNMLSKKMEELQAKWKTIGFASKKDNQKIYDRFRAACDKFYNAKRDYYAKFKDVMQENLKKKEELCAEAEKLMESEDWKKTTDQLINLQKVWKSVGPVARKQSDVVWKRFRAACDEFFDKKAKHFGGEDEKFGENLTAKRALIEEIKAYAPKESKDENIAALRGFQERWNSIGFVPFKEKEEIVKEYDDALNLHFKDLRDPDEEKKMNRLKRLITDAKSSGKGDRGIRFEREKLLAKFRKVESDISTLENNMGFFAKSKNADLIKEDIKKKIAAGKEELKQLEEKIKMIDKNF